MSLYFDLVLRLQTDAAASVNAMLRFRAPDHTPPVRPGQILAEQVRPGGPWYARVAWPGGGWLSGYSGDHGTGSEVEALCALIERAGQDVETAGGAPPPHMLRRLDASAPRARYWIEGHLHYGATTDGHQLYLEGGVRVDVDELVNTLQPEDGIDDIADGDHVRFELLAVDEPGEPGAGAA